jgi:hypothetical protein
MHGGGGGSGRNVSRRNVVSWMRVECFQQEYGLLDDEGMSPGGIQFGG